MGEFVDRACINVEGTSYGINCGLCGNHVFMLANSDADGNEAACVACGNAGTAEQVAAIAIENAKDELQLALNREMQKAAGKSKIFEFSGKTTNDRSYRFVVDFSEEAE